MELDTLDRENPDYQSFLLRLWRVKSTGPLVWRASLESTATGRRQGFSSLENLFAYLEEQTTQPNGEAGESQVHSAPGSRVADVGGSSAGGDGQAAPAPA